MDKFIIIIIILVIWLLLLVVKHNRNNVTSSSDTKLLQKYYKELELNPNNARAYMEIARDNITAYPKPYNTDQALNDISKAIELDSTLTEAYQLRAMLYYYTIKDTEKALKDIEKMLELEPNNDFALDFKKDVIDDKK